MAGITPGRGTICIVAAVLGTLTSGAAGLNIVPTYVNGSGEVWDAARQGVIEQAIADWEASVLDDHVVEVSMEFMHAGSSGFLAQWSGGGYFYPGDDVYPWTDGIEHTVYFNVDHFSGQWYTWWDSTPTTGDDLPFYGFDAVSVARHEFGHMMGFTDAALYSNDIFNSNINRWTSHIPSGTTTFDPGGLNVQLASLSDLSHVADSGATADDLMVPALVNGERRSISRTDLQMLELAHGYTLASIPGDFDGDEVITAADVDMLWPLFGTSTPPTDGKFDLTGDNQVTFADARQLVESLVGTSMADTDLSGTVDICDLGNLANRYRQTGTVSDGDTDGNGLIDICDLGNLANDYDPYLGTTPAPEPASALLLVVALPWIARRRVSKGL